MGVATMRWTRSFALALLAGLLSPHLSLLRGSCGLVCFVLPLSRSARSRSVPPPLLPF